ncbi:SDR family oxidoreductase [Proteobacteria bacterium 005FR1]|nr:SDR family oxidoreductase [Proteobacteria bacterium 005FR1]
MSKSVVITGANRGIGLSLAKQYQARGDKVHAICRSPSEELSKLGVDIVDQVDVNASEGIEHLLSALKDVDIDILINNAGILRVESLGSLDRDTIRDQFSTNALAPLVVTEALLPRMKQGSKVAMITSRMGSVEDNSGGGYYGYRMSKAALNAASKSLAIDLKPRGIAVAILHPGFVATDMVNGHGDISPDEAAQRLVKRIDECTLQNTGTFWHSNGDLLPW